MGNTLTRILTRPDIHPNIIEYYDTQLEATRTTLTKNQALFTTRAKKVNQLIAELEAQVAKDVHFRRTMMEMLVSARSLKKRVQRLEAATKRRGRKDISKKGLRKRMRAKSGAESGVTKSRGKGRKGERYREGCDRVGFLLKREGFQGE